MSLLLGVLAVSLCSAAQQGGRLSGTVSMQETGDPLHGAIVLIVELGRSASTDDDGSYRFDGVPPGAYHVVAHLDSIFNEAAKTVAVVAGEDAVVDFLLGLSEQKYEITVTAAAKEQTPFESFNSVDSLDAYDLTFSRDVSLGETLNHQVGAGVAKRSFGPGSSRPIIRGFDGDRVLIMEDGIRTGTLSSQSGDHGEVVNPAQLERLEIVKGPATLLYSGNAIGGTVNAISRHHELHRHPHQGLRGYVSGSVGSANAFGGGSAGFEYGVKKWMLWASAAATRSSDYTTPQGEIFNSRARIANGGGGFGWFGEKTYFSVDVKTDRGQNGVPFAESLEGDEQGEAEHELERVSLDTRRQSYRIDWGVTKLSRAIESFSLKLSQVDWEHDEVEFFQGGGREIGTAFDNSQFVYRGVFEQAPAGRLSGQFGFWGIARAYEVSGEEALSPPVDQTGAAAFVLEELGFERVKFQFGGRVETERYDPAFAERGELPAAVDRDFTGGSVAAGVHVDAWKGGAAVANFARSYRAPALEELYNFGPHAGNLAFEVGDPNLGAEIGNGVDLSLRHNEGRVRGELNLFRYGFDRFIFPFATGEVEEGLKVIEFTQRNARFTGAEANLNLGLQEHAWLNLGMDFVDAQEADTNTPLPRIPPLRGKIALDLHRQGLRFAPELILASRQHQTFTGETETAGYAVVNLKASYTLARRHLAHQWSINLFNVGDRIYRNHSSFIKDLAPEIGRGVRFTYLMRFF